MKNQFSNSNSSIHLLVDLWGAKAIDDLDYANTLLSSAAEKADATVLAKSSHAFTLQGLTAAILLAEGHISLHTWPEYDYIALDIFLLRSCRHDQILSYWLEILEAQEVEIKRVNREIDPDNNHQAAVRNTLENKEDGWFWENTMPGKRSGNVIHGFIVKELLYKEKSPCQEIMIFENPTYGRMLVLDGIIQIADSDEFIYNEMLVHSILLSHLSPCRILVVGGGTGGALRECLRHDVEKVVLVEIDEKVIELGREYFSHVNRGSFDDERVEIRVGDAQDIIKDYHDYFDVIIVDSSDAVGPSEALYETNFYKSVYRALKPDGQVTLQVGSLLDQELLRQTYERLGQFFPDISMIRYTVASYNCGECCFVIAGKTEGVGDLSLEELQNRFATKLHADELRYYSPELHLGSQLIPPYLKLS